jgi:hypothetical protein
MPERRILEPDPRLGLVTTLQAHAARLCHSPIRSPKHAAECAGTSLLGSAAVRSCSMAHDGDSDEQSTAEPLILAGIEKALATPLQSHSLTLGWAG